jgi:hypothetical protein
MNNGIMLIGGSRASVDGAMVYGGAVKLQGGDGTSTFADLKDGSPVSAGSEDFQLQLAPVQDGTPKTEAYSTEGKMWTQY